MSTPKKAKFELISRPPEELASLLSEHLDVLQTLCSQYDLGKKHYASEIALNPKVLLSDTPGTENRSLLHQLNWESTSFVDTAKSMNDGDPNISTAPASGLAFTTTHHQGDQLVEEWEPNIGMLAAKPLLSTPYKAWWEVPILHTNSGDSFPRRRIIRQVANQDRGGHVAPGIEKAYYQLTRNADYGYQSQVIAGDAVSNPSAYIDPARISNVDRSGAGNKIVRALVRQIAHEVLLTLLDNSKNYIDSIPAPQQGITPIMFIQFMHKAPPSPTE